MKPLKRHVAGFALNAFLRASIAAFLADTLRHPHDPRYEGKAIPVRNLLIVGSLSLVFPLLYLRQRRSPATRQRWRQYPVWPDNLYLSIFWLDMAGNFFNLYDRYKHFDLIPHCHGTGALAAVLLNGFDMPPLKAIGVTNGIHALLEAQEYLTDVFFGTHNVRGAWDSEGDLAAGLVGTLAYVGISRACWPRITSEPPTPNRSQ
ncbi:MAG: hypothetical protein ACM3N4_11545 [Nitrososphaerota archaeon]